MKKEYGVISGAYLLNSNYLTVKESIQFQLNLIINYREGVCLEYGQTGYGFFGRQIKTWKEYEALKNMVCLYTGRLPDSYTIKDLKGLVVEFESYKNGKIKNWRVMHELIFMQFGEGYKYMR